MVTTKFNTKLWILPFDNGGEYLSQEFSLFLDTFGIIQVMTNGGPGNSTATLIYKVYKDGFVGMDPGSSSAQSVILMLVVIGLTLVQFRYLEKKVHYEWIPP